MFTSAGAEALDASSFEECFSLCQSRPSCTYASFKTKAKSSAVEEGAASFRRGTCFLIHGDPGCIFLSRDFQSGGNAEAKA